MTCSTDLHEAEVQPSASIPCVSAHSPACLWLLLLQPGQPLLQLPQLGAVQAALGCQEQAGSQVAAEYFMRLTPLLRSQQLPEQACKQASRRTGVQLHSHRLPQQGCGRGGHCSMGQAAAASVSLQL